MGFVDNVTDNIMKTAAANEQEVAEMANKLDGGTMSEQEMMKMKLAVDKRQIAIQLISGIQKSITDTQKGVASKAG